MHSHMFITHLKKDHQWDSWFSIYYKANTRIQRYVLSISYFLNTIVVAWDMANNIYGSPLGDFVFP